ncbi:hypothetical protein [Flavobacterium anhuiense]|uniref:hypothetical protein n=1 Tax=Flavobacterium anhuiense TaxID=459526 RepID=UPI0020267D1F|nr:hypothetical protein [Flavobacterium anhuiense]URM37132.1 hypothetical protein LLY39_00635 [Flavobacterium anhuiense]
MMFWLLLLIVIVGGCVRLGRFAGNSFFPDKQQSPYINKSTTIIHNHHHNYHDNRSIYVDGKHFPSVKK